MILVDRQPPMAETTAFTMDADGLVNAAYARLGGESMTGYEGGKSALRNIQLLLQSWQNRGIMLWKIERRILWFVTGQASYVLPVDTADVLELAVVDSSGRELAIERTGRTAYVSIGDKLQRGRPNMAWLDRQAAAPVLNLYPVPDGTCTGLAYYRVGRFLDTPALVNGVDMPARFLPAMVSGLAYYLGRERPTVSEDRLARLKGEYETDFGEAIDADTDRAPMTLNLDMSCYQGSWT